MTITEYDNNDDDGDDDDDRNVLMQSWLFENRFHAHKKKNERTFQCGIYTYIRATHAPLPSRLSVRLRCVVYVVHACHGHIIV